VIEEKVPSKLVDDNGQGELYAAVDLGSNSFHMLISSYQQGKFNLQDRHREMVRLAGGMNAQGQLDSAVADRALQCLQRFNQLLKTIPHDQVRVVGTSALRRLQDKDDFLNRAESALGQKIEIIDGLEEARLIYLGVCKWSSGSADSRLVIDIGGGSTEVIVGRGDTAICRESLDLGCVVQSNLFFADGVLSKERFSRAKLRASLLIQPILAQFKAEGWNNVIGCSGTVKAVARIVREGGWSKTGINKPALYQLLAHVLHAGHMDELEIASLSSDRAPVFAGGLSILLALFESFEFDQMSVSDIALREGVLYDLVSQDKIGN